VGDTQQHDVQRVEPQREQQFDGEQVIAADNFRIADAFEQPPLLDILHLSYIMGVNI
jgi:hypothetical protein